LERRSSLAGVTRWCTDVAPVKLAPVWRLLRLESIPQILKLKPELVIGSVPFKRKPRKLLNILCASSRSIREPSRIEAGHSRRRWTYWSPHGRKPRHCKNAQGVFRIRSAARGKQGSRFTAKPGQPAHHFPALVAELVELCGAKNL